jgi:8-oxo-dGTP pyrophosphatase MutT (NUDIX family)
MVCWGAPSSVGDCTWVLVTASTVGAANLSHAQCFSRRSLVCGFWLVLSTSSLSPYHNHNPLWDSRRSRFFASEFIMHRASLLHQLDIYRSHWPEDGAIVERFKGFVRSEPDCFLRSCVPGHVTASAWILDHEGKRALLTHHAKLNKWLQCGGHVDGDPHAESAALREAREESGLQRFGFHLRSGVLVPLDLDVHPIPARGSEPEHLHYDVRFLLIAAAGQVIQRSDESLNLKWFGDEELRSVTEEESVLRLAQRARAWLGYSRP